tara:strand:- start:1423 stop:2361 length:939 start_codon:yes stop_codon:yes gene_type:complete
VIYQTKNPILIVIFNRPEIVSKVFRSIKKAKPETIYVFADGPRKKNKSDEINCQKTRDLFDEKLDWECNVIKKYYDKNLGCQLAVSKALEWFFSNEEQGIIFDDDCVASISFFRYCDELLEMYKNNTNILLISGNNYFKHEIKDSYFISKNPCFYGWATWRRSWKNYDPNISHWPKLKKEKWINHVFKDKASRFYWSKIFDETFLGKKNTWDYQWWLLALQTNSLTIRPKKNLVKHIGTGKDSTHIKSIQFRDRFSAKNIDFPLIHPKNLLPFEAHDKFENTKIWKIKYTYFKFQVSNLIKFLKKLIPIFRK